MDTSSVQLSYFADKLVCKGKQRDYVWLPIAFQYIVIHTKDVLLYKLRMYYGFKFHYVFPPINLEKFFVGFLDLRDYEMTDDKNVCEFVSL